MAPSSQKNTKSVVKMWRGPLHAYHDGLRAVITEAAASGSLSGPSVRGPGGTRIFANANWDWNRAKTDTALRSQPSTKHSKHSSSLLASPAFVGPCARHR